MAKKTLLELVQEENQELREIVGNLGKSAIMINQYKQVLQIAEQMQRLLLEVRTHALPLNLALRIDRTLDDIKHLG